MFKKKDEHSDKAQNESSRGFTGNVPTSQSRRVISPFVDRKKTSDSTRRLDDFQRVEGYQSFTPRTVGMPMSENEQALDADSSVAQTGGEGDSPKKRPHLIFRLLKRLF